MTSKKLNYAKCSRMIRHGVLSIYDEPITMGERWLAKLERKNKQGKKQKKAAHYGRKD